MLLSNKSSRSRLNAVFVLFFLLSFGLLTSTVQAEIRVLAAGGNLSGPYAAEQIFANGDLNGYVDRPGWSDYRLLTTADIIENYDVLIIPYNTADWQYDFDWTTRLEPFLASGGGVIWETPMTTGTAGAPIFTMQGIRYTCNGGVICYIPNSPLDVLSVPGITDGITSAFTTTTGYFPSWDPALAPFLQADATDLGTITYGLYGEISSGRIVITSNAQDDRGDINGLPEEVNAYNLLVNKIQWAAASTLPPDPNLRIVPDLDGLTEADAVTALVNAGLAVNIYYTLTNEDISGNVVAQDPQAGAAFLGDATVNVFVVEPATGAEVTVPDIKGMLTADAETTLNAAGLDRGSLVWSSHPTVPAGAIISQTPAAGQTSTVGWIVDVAESTGPNPGTVPFVKWLPQADAEAAIAAAGYVSGTITLQSHNVIPAGNVVEQLPGDDITLAAGSPVDLVISSGPEGAAPIIVPDVVGQTQTAAETAITSAGLTVSVTTTASDAVAAGDVISQSPAGGIEVTAGSLVSLIVSSGPAPVVVTVPDVVGVSQVTAENTITAAGLIVGNVTTANSDTVAAGDVISQNPAAGTSTGEGSTVDLVVSSGPAPVVIVVPGVEGLSQAAAESTITNAGLTVGAITTANSSTVAAGNVISQTPVAGSNVAEGSTVDLVISVGPALVAVPSVVGELQATAEMAIISAGLAVGTVATASSNTVAAGNVISQTPAGGTDVEEGTSVDLVISTGPDLVTVPDVVGSSYSTAIATITNAGLTVGNVSTVRTRRSCGRVSSQSPTGGASVAAGTAVDLVITRTRFCNPL